MSFMLAADMYGWLNLITDALLVYTEPHISVPEAR